MNFTKEYQRNGFTIRIMQESADRQVLWEVVDDLDGQTIEGSENTLQAAFNAADSYVDSIPPQGSYREILEATEDGDDMEDVLLDEYWDNDDYDAYPDVEVD